MLSLSKYGAIFRQFGVNFRVCFSHNASYVFVPGHMPNLWDSPVRQALDAAGARIVQWQGCEGNGAYLQIESI